MKYSYIEIEFRIARFVFAANANHPSGAQNGIWVGWIKSETWKETIAVGLTPFGWREWSWDFEDEELIGAEFED